MKDTFVLPDYL